MGCWTSASRKAVLPVFEQYNGMLYYPTFYEGLEQSKNVIYTGQEATQQIIAGLDWIAKEKGAKTFYLHRLRLHLAAHLEQDRAQAHRERSARARSSARSTIRSATPSSTRYQQDQADQARRDLRRSSSAASTSPSTSSSRPPASTSSKQTLLTISVTEDEIDGIGGENIAGAMPHEVLPVARQPEQQGLRAGVQEDVGREDRDRRRHPGCLSRSVAVES